MNRFEAVIALVLAHESEDAADIALMECMGDEQTREAAHRVLVVRAEREGQKMEVTS